MAPRQTPPRSFENQFLEEFVKVRRALESIARSLHVHRPSIASIALRSSLMPASLVVGKSLTYSIVALDANGVALSPQPAFDAPPVFTEDSPAVASLAQAPLASVAVVTGLTPGVDTVSASVAIGGVTFTASDVATVTAPAPVVASIKLVAS